jgi:hypothetical protein
MIHSPIQPTVFQIVGIQSILAILLICILLISGCVSFSKDFQSKTTKLDYGQDSQDKIVIREFTNPIPSVSAFNLIVQSVITDNPYACVGYTADGENHDPVEKTNEAYTAQIFYKDNNGNIVGTTEIIYNSSAEYESGVASIPINTKSTASQGGIVIYDSKFDIYSAVLKCHDANGENYYVVFTRDYVMLAYYSDDSIRTQFETWADSVASLTPVKETTKQKMRDICEVSPLSEPYFLSNRYNRT